MPLPEFCRAVADIGLTAMDLLTEAEWPVAHDHGLPCSMGSGFGGTIADGLNVKANHDKIVESLERGIPPVIQPQEVYDSLASGGLSGYPRSCRRAHRPHRAIRRLTRAGPDIPFEGGRAWRRQ
jgi:hypothetical protein